MSDNTKTLVVVGLILWWMWKKEETSVNLMQTCCYPSGFTLEMQLGGVCPIIPEEGGQGVILPAGETC